MRIASVITAHTHGAVFRKEELALHSRIILHCKCEKFNNSSKASTWWGKASALALIKNCDASLRLLSAIPQPQGETAIITGLCSSFPNYSRTYTISTTALRMLMWSSMFSSAINNKSTLTINLNTCHRYLSITLLEEGKVKKDLDKLPNKAIFKRSQICFPVRYFIAITRLQEKKNRTVLLGFGHCRQFISAEYVNTWWNLCQKYTASPVLSSPWFQGGDRFFKHTCKASNDL